MKSNNKALGRKGEEAASQYLAKKGLKVIETNYRLREGEIDLIALDGEVIVFVEVKTRKRNDFGHPMEAVDTKKQSRIRRVAEIYLAQKDWSEREVRFDAFSLQYDHKKQKWQGQWIKHAF